MAALSFPENPSDGDLYQGYIYDATAGVWNSNPQQIASRFVTSANPPSNPSEGDGWFDSTTGNSYSYYDGTWVQLGAFGAISFSQLEGLNLTSPANGESLVFDGTNWVNQNVSVDVYDVSTDSTGKFALPSGTTAERPVAPNAGDIRFNTETGEPEWYSPATNSWLPFRSSPQIDIEYVVVAGGGGAGGAVRGGGGGAGGYRSSVYGESSGGGSSAESVLQYTSGELLTVSVGAGGSAGPYSTSNGLVAGSNGSDSVFGSITSIGGGAGGASDYTGAGADPTSGGSGGGGWYQNGYGNGTTGQGYRGGQSGTSVPYGGGGGGAGMLGGDYNHPTRPAKGGDGVQTSITGTPTYLAGGGSSGTYPGQAGVGNQDGGLGGGGASRNQVNQTSGQVPSNGVNNTGGGGGSSGNGGSGIVIIRYPSNLTLSGGEGLTYVTSTFGDKKVTQFTAGVGTVTFS